MANENVRLSGERDYVGNKKKENITWTQFGSDLEDIKSREQLEDYLIALDEKEVGGRKFIAKEFLDYIDEVFNADRRLDEIKPASLCEAIKKIRRIELARLGTEFTLGKIKSYEELNAATELEGDEILKRKARELWNFFVVHQKGGGSNTDLDGKCSLALYKEAGVEFDFKKDVKYVDPGEFISGALNVDTSGTHRVSLQKEKTEDNGREITTLLVDHHDSLTGNKTSGTQESYDLLVSMGLLEESKELDALVEFVTRIDNLDYPEMDKYFGNSHKTLSGLERFVRFDALKKFFTIKRNRENPYRELSEDDMRKYGLIYKNKAKEVINRSEDQRKAVEASKNGLEKLEQEGLIIESEKYGKIAINIGEKIPGGFLAAKAFGCDAYLIWSPDKKSFFISTSKPIEEEFSQGKKIRQRMWIKPMFNTDELTITLAEIIEKMTGGKIEKEKLERILQKEKEYSDGIPTVEQSVSGNEKSEPVSLPKEELMAEKNKFSEKEMQQIVEVYKEDARKTIELIKTIDYAGKYSYDKDDVQSLIEIGIRRFWIKLEEQMKEEGQLSGDNIKKTIEQLKIEIV